MMQGLASSSLAILRCEARRVTNNAKPIARDRNTLSRHNPYSV